MIGIKIDIDAVSVYDSEVIILRQFTEGIKIVNDRVDKASELEEQDKPSFEESLKELEEIVARMESGEQSLEKSLSEFERGIKIVRHCQRTLEEAEQRVSVLTRKDGDEEIAPFNSTRSE